MTQKPFNTTVLGFETPVDAPKTDEQAAQWQEANRSFWEHHPMRYDWKQSIAPKAFSPEFYQEIDERFLTEVKKFMPWDKIPFDPLINFDELARQDVLEIGVGCGTHAQLLATHARSFTGIDLTDYAVKCTSQRSKIISKGGKIVRMDAEKMAFPDNSFDFIWSWGVIHHSSDTRQILREMNRVLRPGGRATVMVYHRSFWHYYVLAAFFHGIIRGQLFREKSLNKVLQMNIDGAIARHYKFSEWRNEVADLFSIQRLCVYASKPELFPLPGGRLKTFLMRATPNFVTRFFGNTLRLGLFLVAQMSVEKK